MRKTILGKGAFRRFKEFIATHPAEKELWLIFKEQREMSHVEQWLALLPFPFEPFDPYAERRKARLTSLEALRGRRIRVRRVDHVHLPVHDLEATRGFYRDLLQLPPAEESAGPAASPPRTASFRCGNLELHLVPTADPAPVESSVPALALEVASLDQAREVLEAAGLRPGPDEGRPGGKGFVVADPSGNRLELVEPATVAEGAAQPS